MQGFQFYVLKFFLLSKRIFEGFELVLSPDDKGDVKDHCDNDDDSGERMEESHQVRLTTPW